MRGYCGTYQIYHANEKLKCTECLLEKTTLLEKEIKKLKELLKTSNSWCPECGCTEMLCGHNKKD